MRLRRAERAYQKMLLGRDALISKVGPTPHDVALCVPHYPYLFLILLIGALMTSDFHRMRNRGHHIQFVSPSNARPRAPIG